MFFDPPAFDRLQLSLARWPKRKPFHRIHDARFGATEFNPGLGDGRFHPLEVAGTPVPTLYASETGEGVVTDILFQGVTHHERPRHFRRERIKTLVMSTITCSRPLGLVKLFGGVWRGLKPVKREDLLECDADHFEQTRKWATALYWANPRADGLVWVNKKSDDAKVFMLFGDRIRRQELEITEPPLALYRGEGLKTLQRCAMANQVVLID